MESNNSRFSGEYSWDTVCLKEISLKIGSGSTPRGGESAYIPERKKFAFIRSQNVYDFKFDVSGLRFISDEDANKLKGVHLQKDDVLINITGDGVTFSRCCLVPEEILPAAVNQHVAIIRLDKSKCLPGYLMAYLCLPETKAYIESFNAGGSRRAITKGHIESFEIPLPPMLIQEHISRVTLGLLAKQSINTQINQTLEQMAQALFKSWFVDFDPVVDNALDAGFFEQNLEFPDELLRRAEARKAVRESADFKALPEDIRQLFPAAFEESTEPFLGLCGWVPKGWKANAIGNLCKCIKGISYKSSELSRSDTALVTLKSFQRGGGYRLDGLKPYIGSYKKEQEVVAGDLIIAYTDVTQAADIIGKPAIVISDPSYKRLVVSLDVSVIRPNQVNLKFYLYGVAKTLEFQSHTYAYSTGTTVLHLSKNAVPDFMVTLPSQPVLQRYHDMVSPLFDAIEQNTCSLRTLKNLRDTLLPKLILGELRLDEIKSDLTKEAVA